MSALVTGVQTCALPIYGIVHANHLFSLRDLPQRAATICLVQIPPAKPQKYSRGRIWAATARSPDSSRYRVGAGPARRTRPMEPFAAGTVSLSSLHPNSSSDPLQAPKPRFSPWPGLPLYLARPVAAGTTGPAAAQNGAPGHPGAPCPSLDQLHVVDIGIDRVAGVGVVQPDRIELDRAGGDRAVAVAGPGVPLRGVGQLPFHVGRSEERRVGKECVSPCRSRGVMYH